MTQPVPPTALDQLLVKPVAIAGVPLPSRQYLNFAVGASGEDNPDFTVNGQKVGSTDITLAAGLPLAVNVKAYGATGDGTTDDTAACAAAIAAVIANPAGGTVFFPNGTYKLTSQLTISTLAPQALRIYGEGRSSVLLWLGTDYGFVANTTSSIEIDHLQFSGSLSVGCYFAGQSATANRGPVWCHDLFFSACLTRVPALSGIFGVEFAGAGISDGWVYDCEFYKNGARSTNVGPVVSTGTSPPVVSLSGSPAAGVTGMVLEVTTGATLASGNVRFQWSEDQGTTWTSGAVGAASVVLGASGFTAAFAAGTYTNDNVYVANFYSAADAFAFSAYDIYPAGQHQRIHALRNRVTALWDDYGIVLFDSSYSEIVNNTIDMGGILNRRAQPHDDSGYGIAVYSSVPQQGNRVQGNTVSNAAGMGIYFQNSYDFVCTGNSLFDVVQDQSDASLNAAAICSDVGKGVVSGNLIVGSGHYGIACEGGYYTVSANRIDSCENAIILDSGTEFTTVSGNVASGCARGIYSRAGYAISQCAITGNSFSGMSYRGIDLSGAADCSIVGNQVDGVTGDGIYVDSTSARCTVTSNNVTGVSSGSACYAMSAPNCQVAHNVASGTGALGFNVSGAQCTVVHNDASQVTGTPYTLSGSSLTQFSNRTTSGAVVGGPTVAGQRGSAAETSTLAGLRGARAFGETRRPRRRRHSQRIFKASRSIRPTPAAAIPRFSCRTSRPERGRTLTSGRRSLRRERCRGLFRPLRRRVASPGARGNPDRLRDHELGHSGGGLPWSARRGTPMGRRLWRDGVRASRHTAGVGNAASQRGSMNTKKSFALATLVAMIVALAIAPVLTRGQRFQWRRR